MHEDILDRLGQLRDDLIQACNKINQMRFEEQERRQPYPEMPVAALGSLTDILAQADEHQASHLYRHFPGESRSVAKALHQLGWRRVKREKGIFWVRATEAG